MIPGAQVTYKPTHATIMLRYQLLYANICSSSSIDYISRRVQELVEKINNSRTNDQKVMDNFQEQLTEKVVETCQLMKEHMYTVYEKNSNEMQVKLQELTEVLESCTKLNSELLEASQALTSLRNGLGISKALHSP
ncbi:hypothetical protein INR49_023028 [Caranx melampygus]|nr:hypothetical protein INR49_023028 [Caranx melampygus]